MGYRSDGCMIIEGEAEFMKSQILLLRMSSSFPDLWKQSYCPQLQLYEVEGGLARIDLRYSQWKIYEGYLDVQEILRIWAHFRTLSHEADEAEGADRKLRGVYIRLGEDDEDTEHREFGEETNDLAGLARGYTAVAVPDETKDLRDTLKEA